MSEKNCVKFHNYVGCILHAFINLRESQSNKVLQICWTHAFKIPESIIRCRLGRCAETFLLYIVLH